VSSEELGGQYVDLYDFADGRLEARCKGQVLPYRVFDKDQRVSHAAIVENKRLGHALSIIKAHQDLKYPPKVKTNSEKNGYRRRERKTEAVEMPWKSQVQRFPHYTPPYDYGHFYFVNVRTSELCTNTICGRCKQGDLTST
jgi:hypothetical protein